GPVLSAAPKGYTRPAKTRRRRGACRRGRCTPGRAGVCCTRGRCPAPRGCNLSGRRAGFLPGEGGPMAAPEPDTEDLIRLAGQGDAQARARLIVRHRERLRQLIALRLDRRLLARVDPSDVVQEALADACAKLPQYLRQPPLPF